MKQIKKLLALLLAVLMLCGLPFSVSAVGTGTEDLAVVQALALPAHIATASGLPADRTIMLCFNKDVTVTTTGESQVKVGFGVVNQTTGANYGIAYGNCVLGNVSGNSIRPDATIAANTSLSKTKNNYVVTLPEGFTVSELFSACTTKNGSGNSYHVVVRLYDYKRGADDVIDGISYVDGENTVNLTAKNNETHFGCQTNANIAMDQEKDNTFDMYDIPVITEDDALTLKSAKWVADNKVTVTFSQPVNVRKLGTSNEIYSGIRLVNSKGQLMRYREGDSQGVTYAVNARDTGDNTIKLTVSEDLQAAVNLSNGKAETTATISQTSKYDVGNIEAGNFKTLSWFTAHLRACQAEHPDEEFRIVYLVQENISYSDFCEGETNWYISSLYGSESGMPLIANHNGLISGDKNDLAIAETTAAIDVDGYSYADITAAVTAANANAEPENATSTITLLDNVTATDTVTLNAGVTLNLNGYTLTADNVVSFGDVKDSASTKGGIAIAKNDTADKSHLLTLTQTNSMLPLYDESKDCYRFYICTLNHMVDANTNGKGYRFGFQLEMDEDAYALLVNSDGDEKLDADIQLLTDMSIDVDSGEKTASVPGYDFNAGTLADYGTKKQDGTNTNWAVILKVSGFDGVTFDEGITVTSSAPIVKSSTGVEIKPADTDSSQFFTYTKQGE